MAQILIIDDEPGIRELVKTILELKGHEVDEAETGEVGLKKLDTKRPDLILLDVMMPGMNGWDVCSAIRKNDALKSLPIAMLTVKGQDEDVLESMLAQADAHITKPFSNERLTRTVDALLSDKEAFHVGIKG